MNYKNSEWSANERGGLREKSENTSYIKLFIHERNTTAQKMTFSIKDFFSKCDQIRRKLQIWSHLLKKSLMENVIFCVVYILFVRNHDLANKNLISYLVQVKKSKVEL